ncbi:MAG TPA: hypothetical protein GXX19_03820 [Syntrophomonadaceae bacterium]|nr:hypothetical protein [Syntrophomonadaceae bacterium]
MTKEQLTAAEAKQEFDRRLCAMDGVIGAGRLPSATRYKRVKPESGSKRKDKPEHISRADLQGTRN